MAEPGRPMVAVDVLAFCAERGQLKLLLVRRAAPPFEGRLAIPGGPIGMNETAAAAAARVLFDKTGLQGLYMEQLYTFTDVDRDPRARTISISYLALAPAAGLRGASGQPGVGLYDIVRTEGEDFLLLPEGTDGVAVQPGELAFDHGGIVRTAILRMAGKLEYTDIGFQCLQDRGRFTLSELCEVYAALSGRAYDLPNFRRFIKKRYEAAGRIEPTGERLKKRGTPAVVYRYKEGTTWNGS